MALVVGLQQDRLSVFLEDLEVDYPFDMRWGAASAWCAVPMYLCLLNAFGVVTVDGILEVVEEAVS
jgi:hypothetical protein